MSTHKATFEFEATVGVTSTSGSKAGWSESWYDPSDETDNAAVATARALMNRRILLLTPGWTITAIRTSRLDANANLLRKGILTFIDPSDGKGQYPGTAQDEQPYDALEVAVNSVDGNHRAFSMRGIGNNVVSAGARYLAPPAFVAAFDLWKTQLSEWALRRRALVGSQAITAIAIAPTTTGPGSPQRPSVRIEDATGFVSGGTVVIKDVAGMTRMNGSWRVEKVLTIVPGPMAWLVLLPKRRVTVGGVYTSGGTATEYTYSLSSVGSVPPGYGTSRRTGRPPLLVRGRRSNRVS